jgi:hypothetical protein
VNPDFLPHLMDVSGSWEHVCEMLYAVFAQDFKLHTTKHDGLSVVYDGRILPDGHGKSGLLHITLIPKGGGETLPLVMREGSKKAKTAFSAA